MTEKSGHEASFQLYPLFSIETMCIVGKAPFVKLQLSSNRNALPV